MLCLLAGRPLTVLTPAEDIFHLPFLPSLARNNALNIDDPFGGGEADYRHTRDEIATVIAGLVEYLQELSP